VAVVLLIKTRKHTADTSARLSNLKQQREILRERLRKLKEAAEHAKSEKRFDNVDDAVRYLNDVLRRASDEVQDNSEE
jgi:CRISPR/Cas system CMR subunit Cmr6 (Cas7 group RAMP superfamily)